MADVIYLCYVSHTFVITREELARTQIYNIGQPDEYFYFDYGRAKIHTKNKLFNNLERGYNHFRIMYHHSNVPRGSYYYISSPQRNCGM